MKGFKRLFSSSKGIAAMIALQTVMLVNLIGLDAETAQTISYSVVTVMGLYIGGTAFEDRGKI